MFAWIASAAQEVTVEVQDVGEQEAVEEGEEMQGDTVAVETTDADASAAAPDAEMRSAGKEVNWKED